MIRYIPLACYLEVDTETRRVDLVITANGADGRVVVQRTDVTNTIDNELQLAHVFEEKIPTPPVSAEFPDLESEELTRVSGDPAVRRDTATVDSPRVR